MLPPSAPPPDREPMVSSLPSKSNTAPVASANEIGVASLIILSPPSVNEPADIVNWLNWLNVPSRVNAADPTLVNEPKAVLTAPSVYTCDDRSVPLNVVAVLLLPAVNVIPEATSTRPAPAIEAMVSAASTSYTPLVPTLTAVLSDKVPVTLTEPAEIVVAPV